MTEMSKKILVVEDERDINELIHHHLSGEGFVIKSLYDGANASAVLQRERFDMVLLDVLLPGVNGWELCKQIRRSRELNQVPVIFITALGKELERLKGFDIGADDYIVKPFSHRELISRVKALFKRLEYAAVRERQAFDKGQLKIDFLRHKVFVRQKAVHLTGNEFKLLHLLVANEGKVFNREELVNMISSEEQLLELGNIDVHIFNLRRKIEDDPKHPAFIKTVWGVGYKFESQV